MPINTVYGNTVYLFSFYHSLKCLRSRAFLASLALLIVSGELDDLSSAYARFTLKIATKLRCNLCNSEKIFQIMDIKGYTLSDIMVKSMQVDADVDFPVTMNK